MPRTETFIAPAFLAPALVNGDVRGLEDRDMEWLLKASQLAHKLGGVVTSIIDDDEPLFSRWCDLPGWCHGAMMTTYVVLVRDTAKKVGE